MSFQREINRLAGTNGLEAQRAANVLAGTTGKEFNGVVQLISLLNGGDGTKDANLSFAELDFGAISIGGFDTLIYNFSSGFGGTWAFYDGESSGF